MNKNTVNSTKVRMAGMLQKVGRREKHATDIIRITKHIFLLYLFN